MGFLGRIRESLSRTKQQIVERFDEIVRRADEPERRSRPVDVETLEALEELLISADIGVAATERIIAAVKKRVAERREPARSRQGGDPRACSPRVDRRSPSPQRADGHADRRRQRHRQDDDGRQAGEPAEEGRAAAAHLRGRHVPRRGRRAARDLGERAPASTWCARARAPIRRPSCSTRSRPAKAQRTRSGARRHRRTAAHAREPDERARQDPAHRLARSARRAAGSAARARRDGRPERPGAGARVHERGRRQRHRADEAGRHGEGRRRRRDRPRSQAADPLRRRRRRHRRPRAVFGRRSTSTGCSKRNGATPC